MAKRSHSTSRPVVQLRRTIDCLPVATRQAMLAGVRTSERIIAGAYVDGRGGVCPMLAAHRQGGRTNFLPFARAWDRFTRAGRGVREASARELAVLTGQLEASLMSESAVDLAGAIAEHRELASRSLSAHLAGAIARRRELARRAISEHADPRGEIIARRLRRPASLSGRPSRAPQRAAASAAGLIAR
jgi:hypothetical protein